MRHSRCGGEYREVTEAREIRLLGRMAVVEATFLRCDGCGETLWTLEQADAARYLASKAIRREEGLWMPENIKALRKRHGLSQNLLQRLIGKGKKTVVAWESGAVFQSRLADKFLRVIWRHPIVLETLAEMEDVQLPVTVDKVSPPPSMYTRVLHRSLTGTPGGTGAVRRLDAFAASAVSGSVGAEAG